MGYALWASFQLFKFNPVKFVGPAKCCSNSIQSNLVAALHPGYVFVFPVFRIWVGGRCPSYPCCV